MGTASVTSTGHKEYYIGTEKQQNTDDESDRDMWDRQVMSVK